MGGVFGWAMLVPDCIALFTDSLISCGEKNNRYMLPHPHGGGFNMQPCRACEEKPLSHTETDAEKRCSRKKQPPPTADMWQF